MDDSSSTQKKSRFRSLNLDAFQSQQNPPPQAKRAKRNSIEINSKINFADYGVLDDKEKEELSNLISAGKVIVDEVEPLFHHGKLSVCFETLIYQSDVLNLN